ncbi:MAG: glycosyltransferase family 9 protein [Elusimicrobiota bacterium]|nr:glycosyltransferase family 9 protein [Elusimicrobiota bacterium]
MRKEIKKILVIQLKQIGDVLLTTSAVEVLRKNFPKAKIDFLVEEPSHEILLENPFLDHVLVYKKKHPLNWLFQIRKKKYDMVIDFLSNPRSALLTYLSLAKIKAGPDYTSSKWAYNHKLTLNQENNPYTAFLKIDLLKTLKLREIFYPYPKFFLDKQTGQYSKNEFQKLSIPVNSFVVGFAPTSRRITRKWPESYYAKLADMICKKYPNIHIILFWAPGEYETVKRIKDYLKNPNIHLSPKLLSLSKLGAMLKRCSLLISNCNGSKHIAQAVGTPTLGIYSSSNPQNWNPPNDLNHQYLHLKGLECIGCKKNECKNKNHLQCLYDLTPEMVFLKFKKMFKYKPL